MSEIYVNTEKLKDRYDQGEKMRAVLINDMEAVSHDAADTAQALRHAGKGGTADVLEMYVDELQKVVHNITDVCMFDRAALDRYGAVVSRINDIVDAID